MSRTEDAQEIFDLIGRLIDIIQNKRNEEARLGNVPAEWPLKDNNKTPVINFISTIADELQLKPEQKSKVIADVKARLDDTPTVAILESQLLDLQAKINNALLAEIIREIDTPKAKIENATNELDLAINSLEELNKVFGAITIGVNLVAAFVAASGGNFSILYSIIQKLVS